MAGEAKVYRLDWSTRTVSAQVVPVPGAAAIHDLTLGGDGLVYGLASGETVFVMDPNSLKILGVQKLTGYGETTGSPGLQTTNIMVAHSDAVYLLLTHAVVRLKFAAGLIVHEPLARHEAPMTGSLICQGDRLYGACGAELLSFPLHHD